MREMTNQEIEIQSVLKTLQPAMEGDGGGVELVSFEDGVVKLKFRGACLICPSIGMTLKLGIEKTLKEKLPWVETVFNLDSSKKI